MKTLVALIVIVLLSNPAGAQTPSPRFDASATRQAVSAAAASPPPMSYKDRVIAGAVIGGAVGVVSGVFFWRVGQEWGTGPSAASVLAQSGVCGAAFGAAIASLIHPRAPQRRPGIPIGRHVVVDSAVSPARVGGAVTFSF